MGHWELLKGFIIMKTLIWQLLHPLWSFYKTTSPLHLYVLSLEPSFWEIGRFGKKWKKGGEGVTGAVDHRTCRLLIAKVYYYCVVFDRCFNERRSGAVYCIAICRCYHLLSWGGEYFKCGWPSENIFAYGLSCCLFNVVESFVIGIIFCFLFNEVWRIKRCGQSYCWLFNVLFCDWILKQNCVCVEVSWINTECIKDCALKWVIQFLVLYMLYMSQCDVRYQI